VIEIDQLKSAVNSQKTFYILLSNKQFEQLDDTIVSKLYQLDSNKKRGVYQFKP
jgi:hypothetical protein